MILSVLVPNAYPGTRILEFSLRNLAAQSYRDFETVIVDMCYEQNCAAVIEICERLNLRNVVHVPACEAKHIARILHWELYNNAALLASCPWLLYYGSRRYMHRGAVAAVVEKAQQGISTSLPQLPSPESVETLWNVPFEQIEAMHKMDLESKNTPSLIQTGFFSIPRDTFIHKLNGMNEALVIHHWVDNELSARLRYVDEKSCWIRGAILRLHRSLGEGYTAVPTERALCSLEENPKCAYHLARAVDTSKPRPYKITEHVNRVTANDYGWIWCDKCLTIGLEDDEDYMRHVLSSPKYIKAPINVHGVGRNISRLDRDLAGLPLHKKLTILAGSHTNPRYLQPGDFQQEERKLEETKPTMRTDFCDWWNEERLAASDVAWQREKTYIELAKRVRDVMYRFDLRSVIELGCGAGYVGGTLAQDYDYLGIDGSPLAVYLSDTRNSNAKFRIGNIRDIGNKLVLHADLVCTFAVLKHFSTEDFPEILKKVLSVGKYGLLEMQITLTGPSIEDNADPEFHHTWTSKEELYACVEAAGHEVIDYSLWVKVDDTKEIVFVTTRRKN